MNVVGYLPPKLMYLNLYIPLKFFMKRKSLLNLFLLPISLLSVGFLHLNISSLISPPAVRATNWNKYDISKKNVLIEVDNYLSSKYKLSSSKEIPNTIELPTNVELSNTTSKF